MLGLALSVLMNLSAMTSWPSHGLAKMWFSDTTEYIFEVDVLRFSGVNYRVANHWLNYYDLLRERYHEAARDGLIKENDLFYYYLMACRNIWYNLREIHNYTNDPYYRRCCLMDLKAELGKFSIGQKYHWFDLGLLPVINPFWE